MKTALPHLRLAFLLAAWWFAPLVVAADDSTTLAFTSAVESGVEIEAADTLLELLSVEASNRADLTVVERRRIDLVFDEQILNQTQPISERRLQLGKLALADLIVAIRLRSIPDEKLQLMVRVSEPLTGVIRGATVISVSSLDLDDAALRVTEYVRALIRSPKSSGITISVAPFESLAAFEHARPLELMTRDLMTEQLRLSGEFQVLQRSDLTALLKELELVRAGLTDRDDLPDTLPSRDGLYHIHGNVDERYDEKNESIFVLKAKLTHTDSGRDVLDINAEFRRSQFRQTLSKQTARIVETLRQTDDSPNERSVDPTFDESKMLFHLAMRDLRKVKRYGPAGYGYLPFGIPGYTCPLRPRPSVEADSPLVDHLLKKSIARLETVLFLEPHRRDVQYALAYCYSFHLPGIWNAERCDYLCRQVIGADPKSRLAKEAYTLIGKMYASHRGNHRIQDEHIPLLIQQMNFVYKTAPPTTAVNHSSRLHWMTKLYRKNSDYAGMLQTARLVWERAEHPDCVSRERLSASVAEMLSTLMSDGRVPEAVKRETRTLIDRWCRHEDFSFQELGRVRLERYVSTTEQIESRHMTILKNSLKEKSPPEDSERARRTASYFMSTKRPHLAASLLQSFDFEALQKDNARKARSHLMSLAKAYELTGQPVVARDTYIAAAECPCGASTFRQLYEIIERLGGVPLDPDRDIDVTVHPLPENGRDVESLATDGKRLYCGRTTHKSGPGIVVFDLDRKTWKALPRAPQRVTCLALHGNELWAGTAEDGLWRINIRTGSADQYSTDEGLPDAFVASVAVSDDAVYASVGRNGGGVVRVKDDEIRFLGKGDRPPATPQVIVARGKLLAAVWSGAYEWNEASGWKTLPGKMSRLFYENDTLWASVRTQGLNFREVTPDEDSGLHVEIDDGPMNHAPSPYFVIDRGDELWMGGKAWHYFRHSGFYRVNKITGQVTDYGPRDGFPYLSTTFCCYDGVFAKDRFWLATRSGIIEVEERIRGEQVSE